MNKYTVFFKDGSKLRNVIVKANSKKEAREILKEQLPSVKIGQIIQIAERS
jgi:hypothetical protein